MNAVIYARYSSDSQREESIEGQLRECREYAERNNMTIVGTYIDRALSAKTADRPEFQHMIKDSAKELFEIVLVWKLDRFSRDRYDSAHYKHILKKNGVKVISAKEHISEGPEGIILDAMLEGYAEFYSAELSEKIHRGQKENALKGKNNGGGVPLGYLLDKKAQKLVIDPVTAPLVVEVFEKYADGKSVRSIVEDFNARGLKTKRGQPFNINSFSSLLKNRKYIGEYRYQDVVIEGGVPAIVPEDLFNRVQERMEKNRHAPAMAKAKEDYLLTTKLFCGKCERMMVGESGKSHTGAMHYYYKCSGAKRLKDCDKKAVRKDWIERVVVRLTMQRVMDEEKINRLIDAILVMQEQEDTTTPALRSQLAETESSIGNILKAIEQGIFTPSTKQRLDELEARKEEILVNIQTAELQKPKLTREQMTAWFEQFRHGDPANREFQKRLIDTFVNAVYVFDDKLVLTYNYQHGTQTISLEEIESALSSDFDGASPPKINHPQGWIYFCCGLRESKFIPPCGGNPFRSTKNKPPAGVALFLLRPANALPHCASCCALPRAVVYCTYLSPHRLHKGGLPVSTMLERRYRRQHLNCVRHITLDPKGRGVVRIHMIPPREDAENAPFLLLLNGSKLVPLNLSWAILLSCFMDRLEPFAGLEITESDWSAMAAGAVARTHKVYPFTPKERLAEDLQIMIESLVAIARGQEPEAEVAPLTLGEYAPEMTAPHRMDLMVSAMTRDGAWHCNQKCLHCYAAGQPLSDTPELTTAQWKEVLDRLRAANIPQVTFTGGEPTLRADLVELVDAAQWFVTRLNTNGRLLTPALCQKLYDASLDSVQVTLYSHDPATHNALVGAEGFDETVAGIRTAVAAGLSVSVNTPLCSLNTAYDETLRFVHGLGVRYVTCSGLIPSGGAVGDESRATALTEQQLTDVLTKAVAVTEEMEMELDFTSPGWLKEETLRALGLTLVPSCGACLSNMAIAPDGGVIPCQSWLSSQPLGNILADDWDKIWQSERCAAIRAKSAKMEQLCQLRESNREEGTLC